jgi:flagellar basal-body rod protein FlgF
VIRALYTAAAGMVTGLRQQELIAENMANINTPGFKREHASPTSFSGVLARSVGRAEAPIPLTMQRTIGRVGTGSYVSARVAHLEEGTERETGQPLDLMLRGAGFFVVEGDNGVRYTRDGHFTRDALNRLTTADGSAVLGTDGQEIIVPTDNVRISPAGEIFALIARETLDDAGRPAFEVVEELLGTLQVVNLGATQLVRAGNSGFTAGIGGPAAVLLGEETLVRQGSLEEANVDAGLVATQLVTLSRHFSASQHAFTTINQTLGSAVQDIGRVDR